MTAEDFHACQPRDKVIKGEVRIDCPDGHPNRRALYITQYPGLPDSVRLSCGCGIYLKWLPAKDRATIEAAETEPPTCSPGCERCAAS